MIMVRPSFLVQLPLAALLAAQLQRPILPSTPSNEKEAAVDALISNMTVSDLVLQLHLMFADDLVGKDADNSLYESTMRLAPDSPIGVVHDWYPMNKSHYNELQLLNLEKARLKVPLMQFGECLHSVGSFKQSMFPQSLGMAASFDTDLVYQVARAIGREARSIGIHACFSPVLDIGQDPRWGRVQEAWGEDKILTSHMGVAYTSGLSKNASWSDPESVIPVVKHFAAHGAPQSGLNAAPFMGHGNRQVLQDLLLPFKAAIKSGGVGGVMMAYNELDDIPAAVHPILYNSLRDWGFNGFIVADDTAIRMLQVRHGVANSPADAIRQWFEAGGMIQFYDYPLNTYLNTTREMVENGKLSIDILRSHVRKILGVKWDLGLFGEPLLSPDIDPKQIVREHETLTLEAARKSLVLLKNNNSALPLQPGIQGISKIALIGPFADTLNYGGYSGQWAQYPATGASTIRQGMLEFLQESAPHAELTTSWGANSYEFNAQYVVPPYALSHGGTRGGLLATYFADTEFQQPLVQRLEMPAIDWGIYPPPGLQSNNFSAVWEGDLASPVDTDDDLTGWLGVAVGPNTTARLFLDDHLVAEQQYSADGNILPNILPRSYDRASPPPGGAPFTFARGAVHRVRIEYRAFNTAPKTANMGSLNSQLFLFWNLAEPSPDRAAAAAAAADVVVLAVGAGWSSDGENADRATLGLAPSQEALARAVFAAGKPVVLVLEGGRPFAIPQWYAASEAVLSAFFPGQAGGRAVAEVLLGKASPGGRMPISVPRDVGQLPVYYNYKPTAHAVEYVDEQWMPEYPFGFGLSYSEFATSAFGASGQTQLTGGDVLTFSVDVANLGDMAGSYVAQVYLLGRVSSIVQPVKQLVTFKRVYLGPGEKATLEMELDVDMYLPILNRAYDWELEKGDYTFALLEHGGAAADTSRNVTLQCI